MVFNGTLLADGTLGDCGIENGDTLNLTLNAAPCITPDANNILYVDINVNTAASGYTGAGDSWANAVPQLADALKWVRQQHDGGNAGWTDINPLRIYVAKGTYLPAFHAGDGVYSTDGGHQNAFVLVRDVQLYGGFDPSAGVEDRLDFPILAVQELGGEVSKPERHFLTCTSANVLRGCFVYAAFGVF